MKKYKQRGLVPTLIIALLMALGAASVAAWPVGGLQQPELDAPAEANSGPPMGGLVVNATPPAITVPVVARVEVVLQYTTPGGCRQFSATAFDANGEEVSGAVFEWTLRCADGALFEMEGVALSQDGLLSVGVPPRGMFFVRARYIPES